MTERKGRRSEVGYGKKQIRSAKDLKVYKKPYAPAKAGKL